MTPKPTPAELLLAQANFQDAFEQMQRDAFQINEDHGFNEPDKLILEFKGFLSGLGQDKVTQRFGPLVDQFLQARTGLRLALIISELSEALEGVRKADMHDSHIPDFTAEEAEMADAVIRIMNLATSDKCRLAEAIVAKQNYNRDRPFLHGGKKF